MIVDFPSQTPTVSRYWRHKAPDCALDPANANPKPSRIDFFPNSITSPGISSYLVCQTNLPTYSVRPGALGKSAFDGAPAPFTEPAITLEAIAPRDAFPKSRLRIFHPNTLSGCMLCRLANSDYCARLVKESG